MLRTGAESPGTMLNRRYHAACFSAVTTSMVLREKPCATSAKLSTMMSTSPCLSSPRTKRRISGAVAKTGFFSLSA